MEDVIQKNKYFFKKKNINFVFSKLQNLEVDKEIKELFVEIIKYHYNLIYCLLNLKNYILIKFF